MAGRGWRWQNYGCLWMVARFSNAHNKHQKLDLDTLPSMRNILQIELFFEATAFNAIVEEIMKDDTTATVYALCQRLVFLKNRGNHWLSWKQPHLKYYLQHLFRDTLRRHTQPN